MLKLARCLAFCATALAVGCGSSPDTAPTPLTPLTPSPPAGPSPEALPLASLELPLHLTQLADPFETLEQCLQASQNTIFNCYHWLDLCKNGGFSLVLTDIENEGAFLRSGYSIQATQMS